VERLQRKREPDGLGEVVIQSMWSPAVTAVRTKGIACTFQPLKEGYRAWAAGFGVAEVRQRQEGRRRVRFITGSSTGWAGAYLDRRATTAPCWKPPSQDGAL